MIVLHGTLIKEEFLLWAESADGPEAFAATAGGASGVNGGNSFQGRTLSLPGLHPFACTYAALRDALAMSPAGLHPARKQNAQISLRLPTLDERPLASTPLIGRSSEQLDEQELTQIRFERWIVPALRLTPEQVIALLCHAVDQEQLSAGLLTGQDLQYWSLAMRFAGNLISKQHFLPGLRVGTEGGVAVWEPAFPGGDGDRLIRLAEGMPEICLAESSFGYCDDFDGAARDLLVRFIGRIVDALVRTSFAARGPHLPSDTVAGAVPAQLHARWLAALIGNRPQLDANAEELASLCDQIAEWRRPVAVASDSPFRLCLRLEQPVEFDFAAGAAPAAARTITSKFGSVQQLQLGLHDAGAKAAVNVEQKWYVRFLLQSIKDPLQALPVETVLSPAFEDLQLLRGGSVSAREYLFRSLGQAVRLCPEIAESFNQEQPLGIQLTTSRAYEFLTQKAPLLKSAGFSIQLPGWWTEKRQQFSLSINVKNGSRLLNLDELAEFDWQVALGDEPVSQDEIEKLTHLRLPLVCINGNWTELNSEHLNSVLAFLRKPKNHGVTGRELVRMALGDVRVPECTVFGGVIGAGQVADVLSKLKDQSGFEEVAPPENFAGTLRPYQIRGLSWLEFLRKTGFGACLADDMGLGKTVQTLAFVQRTWQQHSAEQRRPTLLVCPTSLLGNWLREVERFTPNLSVLVHHGSDRCKGESLAELAAGATIVLTTYNLLQRDLQELTSIEWDTVVLDEAQNIRNPYAQQTQAAFALRSRFRLALTGTPVENTVSDLWSLMHFLNPGFLGRQADFHERFFVPIQVFQDAEKTRQLRRLTAPFILRRLKSDKSIMPELPEKLERKTTCTLTKEQATLYAAAVADATAVLDQTSGIKRKSLVLTTLLRLKQICNHPALVLPERSRIAGRSGKLRMLTEMLSAVIATGERALVFTQFKDMGALIQQHLQSTFGTEVLFLHGGTDRAKRERMVMRFQADEDNAPPIFVLCLKAGGSGLNLTKATHVFHFDRWWNPAVEDQATDRAFRMGQSQDVQVHKFVCAGTLEERIDEIIEGKKNLASATIGTGENWLTEMSTDQLREVLSLRNTALVEN